MRRHVNRRIQSARTQRRAAAASFISVLIKDHANESIEENFSQRCDASFLYFVIICFVTLLLLDIYIYIYSCYNFQLIITKCSIRPPRIIFHFHPLLLLCKNTII